jgi:hypothetical protein
MFSSKGSWSRYTKGFLQQRREAADQRIEKPTIIASFEPSK